MIYHFVILGAERCFRNNNPEIIHTMSDLKYIQFHTTPTAACDLGVFLSRSASLTYPVAVLIEPYSIITLPINY